MKNGKHFTFGKREPGKNECFPTSITIHNKDCIGCQTWEKELMISAVVPSNTKEHTFIDMFLEKDAAKFFIESVIHHISYNDFEMTKPLIERLVAYLNAKQCAELAGIITKAGFKKV